MADNEGQVLTEQRIPEAYCVCTYSYYNRLRKGEISGQTVKPYVIYLVNHGLEPTGSPTNKYTDLYYGRNKLSDLQIIEVNSGEFDRNICSTVPNNKIIVQVKKSEDTSGNGNGTTKVDVLGLAVKYDDQHLFLLKELCSVRTDGDGSKFLNDKGEYSEPPTSTEYTGTGYIQVNDTVISTTLHAGSNVTISSDGAINATGGSGGTTYQAGTGIDIDTTTTPNPTISADLEDIGSGLAGSGITYNSTTNKLDVDLSGADYSSSTYINVTNTAPRSIDLNVTQLINDLTDSTSASDPDSFIYKLQAILALDDGRVNAQ